MFSGIFFSSDDPGLEPHVRELDARVAALFPEFTDGRASARLHLHHDEFSCRGVSLAEGYRPGPEAALALYYGRVVAGWTTGDYVLALPSFRRDGRVWHPSVDAAARCRTRRPNPSNAALFNHSCHDATVVLRRTTYPEFFLRLDGLFPGGPTGIFRRYTMSNNTGVTEA